MNSNFKQKKPPPFTALNASFMDPSTHHLRPLILDYLAHNCYLNTAAAFAADSLVKHLDADGDLVVPPAGQSDSLSLSPHLLAQVHPRAQVQSAILSGRVDDAIELLNRHFPAVLAATSSESSPPTSAKPSASPDVSQTIIPFTVDPSHLFLDLRILAFLEACRTVPLDPTTAAVRIPGPDTSSTGTSSNIRDPTPTPDIDVHLARLLKHVQELFALAQSLDCPEDRVAYQLELNKISTVLVYKVPEDSPSAKYLAQSRRITLANQINSAILYRLGLPPISKLELYVRYTTVLWKTLNDTGCKVPAPTTVPTGAQLPPRRKTSLNAVAPGVSHSRDDTEIIPSFDLEQFLSS